MPYRLLPPLPEGHTPDHILAQEQLWLRECARDGQPRAHLWQAPQCLIVTRKDTRLPRYQDACAQLAAEGWPVFVRDSGGTAVPHGAGILNLSLMLPVQPGDRGAQGDRYRPALAGPRAGSRWRRAGSGHAAGGRQRG